MTTPQRQTSKDIVLIPKPRVAGNLYNRETAIRTLSCVDPGMGCGRDITEDEYMSWDRETQSEYQQSGWCKECQDRIFTPPYEEGYCTCQSVDVGVGIMYYVDEFCPTHGDPEIIRIMLFGFDYDPDMREDEPPTDLHLVRWPAKVLWG